jgi:predicted nucleic acid-binding protein
LTDLVPLRFEGRVLSVDPAIADAWGRLMADASDRGRPLGAMDGFIAATAGWHDLTLVTRNVADFETSGLRLLNPWRA